jgi:hypothetical protein
VRPLERLLVDHSTVSCNPGADNCVAVDEYSYSERIRLRPFFSLTPAFVIVVTQDRLQPIVLASNDVLNRYTDLFEGGTTSERCWHSSMPATTNLFKEHVSGSGRGRI